MADTKKQAAAKKPAAKAAKPAAAKEPAPTLAAGKYNFSKSQAARLLLKKKTLRSPNRRANLKAGKTQKPKPLYVEKPIGGPKNNGKRIVRTKKLPNNYPVKNYGKPRSKIVKVRNAPRVRASLLPGTVLILLAGVNRGKRVVLLKSLKSGLLLVTGPFKINRCPLRRVHQQYVIATSTRLDLSKVSVGEHVNDMYFRRLRVRRAKKAEGDIFAAKKKEYAPTEERKKDQVAVDKALLEVIKAHPDRKYLVSYLRTPFGLKTGQFPHRMKF